jgi:bis(5'-nucleosyl)-tetraphosphatase (symmetrical)
MSTYAIGDIQGCFNSLRLLLDRISFRPHIDRLWLVGDLVNRGPESLGVLRYITQLGHAARVVLGNHDVFLLAVAEGFAELRAKDTLHDVLNAPDRDELLAWLRRQPLLHREGEYLMVHAGLLPQWTVEEAVGYARDVEAALTGPDYRVLLRQLFNGPTPQWADDLGGWERLTSILRILTRLRACTPTGSMSNFSGPPEDIPVGFAPWFRIPGRRSTGTTIITGHWAALGLRLERHHLALDSGCVWGRQLTAVCLEDRKVFQVDYADRRI